MFFASKLRCQGGGGEGKADIQGRNKYSPTKRYLMPIKWQQAYLQNRTVSLPPILDISLNWLLNMKRNNNL